MTTLDPRLPLVQNADLDGRIVLVEDDGPLGDVLRAHEGQDGAGLAVGEVGEEVDPAQELPLFHVRILLPARGGGKSPSAPGRRPSVRRRRVPHG
jgi:hypothetical protein